MHWSEFVNQLPNRLQAIRNYAERPHLAGCFGDRHYEILNYFRAQKLLSSGVVEGLTNKAKVTMRKSYGFRNLRCLELALYHSLGKLPEPESTHEFF